MAEEETPMEPKWEPGRNPEETRDPEKPGRNPESGRNPEEKLIRPQPRPRPGPDVNIGT